MTLDDFQTSSSFSSTCYSSVLRSFLLFLFFFLTGMSMLLGQNALDAKYDFSMSEQTLPDGLWALGEQTGAQIVFSNNDFTNQKYSYFFQQKTLRQILNTLLENKGFTFSYEEGQILILKKKIPKRTISGYIEDSESGERLIGATIYEKHSGKGTTTNAYGFFSLTIAVAKPMLSFSYLGYQLFEMAITSRSNEEVIVNLKPSLTLTEVVVIGKDSLENATISGTGSELNLNEKMIRLPSLGGEVDVMRIMQQLPGVQSGTDGLGGLHVRGGNADQNLVLLDGVPIYNPYHALGLYSIFDHKIIKKVKYLRGEFPARFGGRMSSVVDVRTKDGNNKSYHAEGTLGLIASKIAVEGPLVKEKGAFYISARRTHLDPFLKRYSERTLTKDGNSGKYNYSFGEVIAKVNHSFSTKNKVYLSFYKGGDDYQNDRKKDELFGDYREQTDNAQHLTWGNTLGVFRWNHQFGNKLFSNTTITYSQFNFSSNEIQGGVYSDDTGIFYTERLQSLYRSRINTFSLKYDLEYIPAPNHYVRVGIVGSQYFFTPGAISVQDSQYLSVGIEFPDSLISGGKREVLEGSVYLEDEWQISDQLKINAGVFSSLFLVKDKNYLLIDPRFSLHWQMWKPLQFHFSINRMSQQLHLLTNTDSGFPSDLWVPSTSTVKPQRAWIFDVGFHWRIKNYWSVSTKAYYKRMSNLINYVEGSNFLVPNTGVLNGTDWEDKVTAGSGLSKGLELLVKRESEEQMAWLSYTLSKSSRQFDAINNGQRFPFRYDLRHVLNLVYSQRLSSNWWVSWNWTISPGSRINIALNEWEYVRQNGSPDYIYQNFGKKNSYQLPSYHRMDISAKYKKKTTWGGWSIDLGIYNLYNRRNIFYIKSDYNPGTQTLGYSSVSLIPILPYFSLNVSI